MITPEEFENRNQNKINTGRIYSVLCHDDRNDKGKYDETFVDDLEHKVFIILRDRNKLTLRTSENAHYFEELYLRQQNELDRDKKYSEYFLDEFSYVLYYEDYAIINRSDYTYDYFFALHLSITDILDVFEFLDYQLEQNFENDFQNFKHFIELILIKYSDLILNDTKIIATIRKYIMDFENKTTNPPQIKPGMITWLGNNETEFVQLVYGLKEAGYISNNGEGMENLIVDFARLMNFPLGKNWQINHSNSIHRSNADYKVAIFDNIKEAYTKYRLEKIVKKKNN